METQERMAQLLLQVSEADTDALTSEWMDLESVLTLNELVLLLKAAEFGSASPDGPLEGMLWGRPSGSPPSLLVAPLMEEWRLRQLTHQARLLRLRLLEWGETVCGDVALVLTPRGAHALNWWLEFLEEQGMMHETLAALPWPHLDEAEPSAPPPSTKH